jgi:tRNA (guanine-N7-)-methyltransferase
MVRRELGDIAEFPDIVIDVGGKKADQRLKRIDVKEVFGNTNPLEVDIGAGKGRFLVARARSNPRTNYLGIERQPGRIFATAKKAFRHGLCNLRLARVEAFEGIGDMLEPHSVSVFYIFFPDPWPKRRHHRRRLVNPEFMDLLHSRLSDGGIIHFASDHTEYAAVVEKLFAADERFVPIDPFIPSDEEKTDFERLFTAQDKPINRFSLAKSPSQS